MIGVLLAEDQTLLRDGFRVIVDADPDLHVVGEAGNGAEAVSISLTEPVGATTANSSRPRRLSCDHSVRCTGLARLCNSVATKLSNKNPSSRSLPRTRRRPGCKPSFTLVTRAAAGCRHAHAEECT